MTATSSGERTGVEHPPGLVGRADVEDALLVRLGLFQVEGIPEGEFRREGQTNARQDDVDEFAE